MEKKIVKKAVTKKKESTPKNESIAKKIQSLSDEINKNITNKWFKTVVLTK